MEENKVSEDRIQQTPGDSEDKSKALNHYKELCKMISEVNFGGDFLQNYQSGMLHVRKNIIITKLDYTSSKFLSLITMNDFRSSYDNN